MKKQIAIIITFIAIGFVIGIILYSVDEEQNEIMLSSESQDITINKIMNNSNEEINTSSSDTKITPNTVITQEICYTQCGHKIITKISNEDFINMTEEEFKKEKEDWQIESFSEEIVVVSKNVEDFCNEHYLLKDVDGYIDIYKLDKDDNVDELVQRTEIATQYLSMQDRKQLEEGIKVYSKQELNKLIEDFE